MFKFNEILQSSEVKNTEAGRNTNNAFDTNMSLWDAKQFWDKQFEATPKISMSDILGKKEEDFAFDNFDVSETRKLFHNFNEEYWESLTKNKKIEIINRAIDNIADKLKIMEIPELEIFEDEQSNCGYYLSGLNIIGINKHQLNNPKGLLDTIAHELRHAYQELRAANPKTKMDYKYQANIENYVKPIFTKDGNCMLFTDYQDQLVEAEARAFAKKVTG